MHVDKISQLKKVNPCYIAENQPKSRICRQTQFPADLKPKAKAAVIKTIFCTCSDKANLIWASTTYIYFPSSFLRRNLVLNYLQSMHGNYIKSKKFSSAEKKWLTCLFLPVVVDNSKRRNGADTRDGAERRQPE